MAPPNITYAKQYFGSTDATRIQNAIGLDFVYEQCFAAKEYNLYGSSRLGVKKDTSLLVNTRFKASSIDADGQFVKDVVYSHHLQQLDTIKTKRILAFKQFELSNHLGNVLVTILDRRSLHDTTIYNSGNDTAALWDADIVSAQDYYPFGMLLPDRIYTADSTGSGGSRYGFNGMERDDEWNGDGNAYDFGARMYDARIGRWLAVDPYFKKYLDLSPFAYTANNPIFYVEIDGAEFDLSNLSSKEQEEYQNTIALLNESEVFAYYYSKLEKSSTVYTIHLDGATHPDGTHYNGNDQTVHLAKLGMSGAYTAAQELFHGYQDDQIEYDHPGSSSTIETEGDLVAAFVTFQAGLPGPVSHDWSTDFFSKYPIFDWPNAEEVQSDAFDEVFQKTVNRRIEYWKEVEKRQDAKFDSYTRANTGSKARGIEKVLKETDSSLIGPRLENGDFYQQSSKSNE